METNKQDTSMEHEGQPEETPSAGEGQESVPAAEAADQESPEVAESDSETVEQDPEEEKAFLLDQLQRAHAELANFRRRTLEDQSTQRLRTTVSVVRSFLPVLDGLEAAVKAGTDEGGDEAIREGLAMIAERVDSVLKDLKVEKIDSKGEDFNPELHEAMLQVDQPDARQGEIVEEVEKGYRCGDLLVRAARVVVARGSESAE